MFGIRLADSSFFPILTETGEGRKRLVLTTSHPDQKEVRIPLCRSSTGMQPLTETLGTLTIRDLPRGDAGDIAIDLDFELDESGILTATAREAKSGTGESTSIATNPGSDTFESWLDDEESVPTRPRRKNTVSILILALIVVLLGLATAFVIFGRAAHTEPVAPIEPAVPASTVDVPPAVTPAVTPPAVTPSTEVDAVAPAITPAQTVEMYTINWGDTLWDISARFYGTPWRFPELAEENRITNPDLIYAENDLMIPLR